MITSESDTKRTPKLKQNKSVGDLILLNKKKLNKLREKKSETFTNALIKLNNHLKKSVALVNIPNNIKRNNSVIRLFQHKEKIVKKRLAKLQILPNINKNKKRVNIVVSTQKEVKDPTPFYLKALNVPKHIQTPAEIVKTSKHLLNGKNPFKKYCFNLEDKVGDFMKNKEKFYDFNNFYLILKASIKEESTGLSIPGNILNRDSPGFLRTFHPINVNTKVKKRITVPDKTLVPTPNELVGKGINYSHITMKDIYNEKNIIL